MSRSVSVYIDVDLDNIDFDDIKEYVEECGYKVVKTSKKEQLPKLDSVASPDLAFIDEVGMEAEYIIERRHDKDFMRRLLSEVLFGHRTATREQIVSHISELL